MKLWTEFLSNQTPQKFQHGNTICALKETALLYVGGDDATDFLQNQLSNDISLTSENLAQLSSFSNAKGRMLGIFRVIKIDGGFLLVMPKSIIQRIMQLLQKFVLMSKVVLADITDSFARFSIITDQQSLISDESFPLETNQVYQSDSLICLRLQSTESQYRYLLLSNKAEEAITYWNTFTQNLQVADPDNFRMQEIEAGIPTLYPATIGAFVLQMSNLQFTAGVSFKKGCYPGQEIIARTHYLGKLKRRMYLAEINTSICPDAGDEICSIGADKPDNSGKVVDAVQIQPGLCILLFIAQIEKVNKNELVLFAQPEIKFSLKNLPYSVD